MGKVSIASVQILKIPYMCKSFIFFHIYNQPNNNIVLWEKKEKKKVRFQKQSLTGSRVKGQDILIVQRYC